MQSAVARGPQAVGEFHPPAVAFHHPQAAIAAYNDALADLALGSRAAARAAYLAAVDDSEKIRARFRSDEFKTVLFGDTQTVFEEAIALTRETGDYEGAWNLSERSRARIARRGAQPRRCRLRRPAIEWLGAKPCRYARHPQTGRVDHRIP
ncbi:hypothetical protein LMG28727_07377 [Paraburkholderia kirstenboschensis]|uniref:hypothetical protein n=1 Tax=Paraburkholderia kirstenboschensis TaxID=1245436 RepID=UPI000A4303FC|nr:hypothetical protein [Paraburkholderia kirstenboschensis]CAD6561262.1 hypothetical protein LMG28727_07377 [Paraburkholderia kirstenboschensis]